MSSFQKNIVLVTLLGTVGFVGYQIYIIYFHKEKTTTEKVKDYVKENFSTDVKQNIEDNFSTVKDFFKNLF